ncbi:MAG: ActS/PrrB/RegB family redox-sensitive histidine kinase [Aliishimia sp.]
MTLPDQGNDTAFDANVLPGEDRSSWIRLRTLIFLRWVAICGQIVALTVAQRIYGLQLEMGLCYLAVGVSVIGNLIAIFVFPENARLSETQNFLMIVFDLLQLGFLLFLTGGLHNPFALLLLGPVSVSASVLTLRSFLIVATTAILIASLLALYHLPLRTEDGFILRVPQIFIFGSWLALIIAVVFFGAYSRRLSTEMHSMSDALSATHMALSREQKLTDLGGVVAAAAHELGTPLATIKLASAELMEELVEYPELHEDAALIREQADRCRDILRDMGRAGKDDLHLRQAPLSAVIEEAAEPHEDRGKSVLYTFGSKGLNDPLQPSILRKPEIIHGIRNLVQNAVDFAHSSVWIEAQWNDQEIAVRIADDGPGYPQHMIGRLGDPFMRKSKRSSSGRSERPGYEGMGLGLFIAKTLLERTGAQMTFANGREQGDSDHPRRAEVGAIVEVVWPRHMIDAQSAKNAIPAGENQRIDA